MKNLLLFIWCLNELVYLPKIQIWLGIPHLDLLSLINVTLTVRAAYNTHPDPSAKTQSRCLNPVAYGNQTVRAISSHYLLSPWSLWAKANEENSREENSQQWQSTEQDLSKDRSQHMSVLATPTSPFLPLMWVTAVPPHGSCHSLQGTAWSGPAWTGILNRLPLPPLILCTYHSHPGLFQILPWARPLPTTGPSHVLLLLPGKPSLYPPPVTLLALTHSTSPLQSHLLKKLPRTHFADSVTFLCFQLSKAPRALPSLPFSYWTLIFCFCDCLSNMCIRYNPSSRRPRTPCLSL